MAKDFIAICTFNYGGGSFGRAPTVDEAVAKCKRSLEQDWKSLFHLDGVTANIGVYDVTGYDSVFWDARGVHPESDPAHTFHLLKVEQVVLSIPSQRKRKRRVKAG